MDLNNVKTEIMLRKSTWMVRGMVISFGVYYLISIHLSRVCCKPQPNSENFSTINAMHHAFALQQNLAFEPRSDTPTTNEPFDVINGGFCLRKSHNERSSIAQLMLDKNARSLTISDDKSLGRITHIHKKKPIFFFLDTDTFPFATITFDE